MLNDLERKKDEITKEIQLLFSSIWLAIILLSIGLLFSIGNLLINLH